MDRDINTMTLDDIRTEFAEVRGEFNSLNHEQHPVISKRLKSRALDLLTACRVRKYAANRIAEGVTVEMQTPPDGFEPYLAL